MHVHTGFLTPTVGVKPGVELRFLSTLLREENDVEDLGYGERI